MQTDELNTTKNTEARRGIAYHLLKQARASKSGGLHTIVFQTIPWVFKLAIALPIVLVIRAIGPVIKIRLSPMHSSHIGAFAANTEIYLCERELGMHGRRIVDLFYHSYSHSGTDEINEKACNQQLKIMWDRTLNVHSYAKWLDRVNHHIPGGKPHKVSWRGHRADSDIHGVLDLVGPRVSFTDEETNRGWNELVKMGIPGGTPFVCFYARDSSYMNTMFPQQDWGVLDHRDSSIQNFVLAAEEMTRRGYFAIRMGAVVRERVHSDNPMIIDYASDHRSDFLDLFLCANCHFFFGGSAGLDAVPKMFRRPIVYTNFLTVILKSITSLVSGSVLLPKRVWLNNQNREMTFREMVSEYGDLLDDGSFLNKHGIEFIENTPNEILAAAVEMEDRLAGRWKTTKEDQELHDRFLTILDQYEPGIKCKTRLSAAFLRENQHLLS